MELGKYYINNQNRFEELSNDDLRVAFKKCKDHIKIRIKQKTLYGAHTEKNLGENPLDYYFNFAIEKLLSGAWEWKEGRNLSEQLIRIVNSQISKEVKKVKTDKHQKIVLEYEDIENTFYDLGEMPEETESVEADYGYKLKLIEEAIVGDSELVDFFEAVRAEYKPAEIAELLGKTIKQLGKIKERLFRRVNSYILQKQKK